MLPAEWREVRKEFVRDGLAPVAQGCDGSFQVNRVPEHDGGHDKVQSAGAMSLVLVSPVTKFAETVKEYSSFLLLR